MKSLATSTRVKRKSTTWDSCANWCKRYSQPSFAAPSPVAVSSTQMVFLFPPMQTRPYDRVIQIADKGAFKGTAEIDTAEIRGLFEGTLTVRQKLIIYPTGKVTGKVRYGKIVIEEGGQLSGEITADAQAGKS